MPIPRSKSQLATQNAALRRRLATSLKALRDIRQQGGRKDLRCTSFGPAVPAKQTYAYAVGYMHATAKGELRDQRYAARDCA